MKICEKREKDTRKKSFGSIQGAKNKYSFGKLKLTLQTFCFFLQNCEKKRKFWSKFLLTLSADGKRKLVFQIDFFILFYFHLKIHQLTEIQQMIVRMTVDRLVAFTRCQLIEARAQEDVVLLLGIVVFVTLWREKSRRKLLNHLLIRWKWVWAWENNRSGVGRLPGGKWAWKLFDGCRKSGMVSLEESENLRYGLVNSLKVHTRDSLFWCCPLEFILTLFIKVFCLKFLAQNNQKNQLQSINYIVLDFPNSLACSVRLLFFFFGIAIFT